jgi:hypothetical protein
MHFVTDYKCRASLSHAQIKAYKLEPEVLWEVHSWASANVDPKALEEESQEIKDLMLESSKLLEKIVELQDIATWPGADKASIRAKMGKIGKSRDEVEAKISRLRSRNSSHDVMRKVRREWNSPVDPKGFEEWRDSMIASAGLLGYPVEEDKLTKAVYEKKIRIERQISDWPVFWAKVPFDQRREVIRGIMRVTVAKGISPDRVKIDRLWN